MSQTCANCRQIIPDTVRYCAYCGHTLVRYEPQPFITRAGDRIETVADVVPVLRRSRRVWRDGVYHLHNGHFETWFRSLGRHDLVDATSRIRQRTRDPQEALERFVTLLQTGPAHSTQPDWLAEMEVPEHTAPAPSPQPAGIPVPCPQCQEVIPGGVRYCAYCGAGVTGPSGPQAFITRSGKRLETIREISQVLNRDAYSRAEAMHHLYNGHFETWFRSLGRYDLVNAVSRIRQSSRDPEVVLNRFLLLVAGSPAPGEVERPLEEQVREMVVASKEGLVGRFEVESAVMYLVWGVAIGGMLFLGLLVLSLLMGQC
jgi:RNA polymerase subunit RPABC4/transcription elongation factor Spt4